jgi:3',5'-cyclic AMP phosphodiesterase CpdA
MADGSLSRRGFLAGLGAVALAPRLGAQANTAKPGLRVAYLTDAHIMEDERLNSDEGIRFALDHLMAQSRPADLVINGGDNLTGTMARTLGDAQAMRRRWESAFRDRIKLPTLYCAGNHDHWGWNRTASSSAGTEPLWGKAFARDMLQLDQLAYSVERGGWKFVVLDSVQPFENRYIGGIDPAQMEWLKGELAGSTPTVVVSHIPITGISPLVLDGSTEENGIRTPFGSIVQNMIEVVNLLDERDNVKLVLGGHIHFEETVSFGGTTYLNGGAVCGSWWRTPESNARRWAEQNPTAPRRLLRAEPGYTMLDLFEDGTFAFKTIRTGWESVSSL